jgi:preprotein translocase subunit YajC
LSEFAPLLPLLAILVLFWLMVIRPASRRQKAVGALQSSLEVGQRVMLTSGIFGTISSLTDERIHLEIAPGLQVEVVRGAVAKVEEAPSPEVDGA